MEQRISDYLHPDSAPVVATVARSAVEPGLRRNVPLAESEWLKNHRAFVPQVATTTTSIPRR
jgi:hypothetical protein